MAEKKAKKREVIVDVGKERKGTVHVRQFTVVDAKTGDDVETVHVAKVEVDKSEGYLTRKSPEKTMRIHKTKASVGRAYPRITPKLPKLR